MKKLCFLGVCLAVLSATTSSVLVEYLTGKKLESAIQTIGKITCTDHQLTLCDKQGNVLGTGPLGKAVIRFNHPVQPTEVEGTCERRIRVYPNPTANILLIEGAVQESVSRIFGLDGNMLQSATGNAMDISTLPAGTYLLQVETEIVKIIKK